MIGSIASAMLVLNGLTLGVVRHGEIILFMTQESLDKFMTSGGTGAVGIGAKVEEY